MEYNSVINIVPQQLRIEFKKLFMDILPKEYNVFYYKSNNQYSIYIAEKPIILNEIANNSIGYINFVINVDDNETNIQFIQSNMQGIGIGHYLLLIVAYITRLYNITIIYLDDDSDKAWNGSIYEKIGCKYINEKPEPEMECHPEIIMNKYEQFYNKYIDKLKTATKKRKAN